MQDFAVIPPPTPAPMRIHHLPTATNSSFRFPALCDNGGGSSRLVLPRRRQDTNGSVVTGQTVDSGLDENKTELGVLVFAVALKVLADSNSLEYFMSAFLPSRLSSFFRHVFGPATYLLDQHVEILRKLGGKACVESLCQRQPYRGR